MIYEGSLIVINKISNSYKKYTLCYFLIGFEHKS